MTAGERAGATLEDLLRRFLREEIDERAFASAFDQAWNGEVELSALSQREYDVYFRLLELAGRHYGPSRADAPRALPQGTEVNVRAAARNAAASLRLET